MRMDTKTTSVLGLEDHPKAMPGLQDYKETLNYQTTRRKICDGKTIRKQK